MAEFSFDLIEEPWIPCVTQDGRQVALGLRALFAQAHELRGIEHPSPLTEAALLRVLLAIVHRAVNGPRTAREWRDVYGLGRFDERLPAYLDRWLHRFDLFSPDAPFYQTPGLQMVDKEGEPVPPPSVRCLMLERASGNNKTLFDHTVDGTEIRLSAAGATHVLLTAQMYSLGGLNKKTTNLFGYQQSFLHGVMVGGIFIALAGRSLFETLVLNLLIYTKDNEPIPNTPEDGPTWERTDVGAVSATMPRGYLDFLTCKCRHLRLVPERREGRVSVGGVHLAQGAAFPEVANPAFYRKRKKDGTWYTPQLDVERGVWRDSAALFGFDAAIDHRPMAFRQVQSMRGVVDLPTRYQCVAYALANNKANPLAWRRERLSIPAALLTDADTVATLVHGMAVAENGRSALWSAVQAYMREVLPPSSRDVPDKISATGVTLAYWDGLEPRFRRFLLDLEEPESALTSWEAAIKRTAREAMTSCVKGRYRNSARSYRAWSAASAVLETRLANLAP